MEILNTKSISSGTSSLQTVFDIYQFIKKVVSDAKCSKEKLILALSKIKSRDDVEKIKNKDLKSSVNQIVSFAEQWQSGSLTEISMGEIIAKLIKLIKNFTKSVVDFGKVWNQSINMSFRAGLDYAKFNAAATKKEAIGNIITGVCGCVAGVLIIGGGIIRGGLGVEKSLAIKGIGETEEGVNVVKGMEGSAEQVEEDSIAGGAEEDSADEETQIDNKTVNNKEKEEIKIEEKTTDKDDITVKLEEQTNNDNEKQVEEDEKAKENEATIDIRKKQTKQVARPNDKFAKKQILESTKAKYDAALDVIDKFINVVNGVNQTGVPSIVRGIFGKAKAENDAKANESAAYKDLVSSRKNQNESIFRNTNSAIDAFLGLSQVISGYIRACVRN